MYRLVDHARSLYEALETVKTVRHLARELTRTADARGFELDSLLGLLPVEEEREGDITIADPFEGSLPEDAARLHDGIERCLAAMESLGLVIREGDRWLALAVRVEEDHAARQQDPRVAPQPATVLSAPDARG